MFDLTAVKGGIWDIGRVTRARSELMRQPQNLEGPQGALTNCAMFARVGTEIVARSRNTSIYRVSRDGRSEPLLLKWTHWRTREEVDEEFKALESLHASNLPTVRVPKPGGRLGDFGYFLEEIGGRSICWYLERGELGRELCFKAGAVLAELHEHWAAGRKKVPWSALFADLKRMPWGLGRKERAWLEQARDMIEEKPVQCSRLYLDYDPKNIIVGYDGCMTLIDPPETVIVGPIWADLATFCVGIRKVGWISRMTSWFGRSRTEGWIRAFLDGYGVKMGRQEEMLLRVFALQRIGELQVYQSVTGRRNPFLKQGKIESEVRRWRRWMTLMLLVRERRRVFFGSGQEWHVSRYKE